MHLDKNKIIRHPFETQLKNFISHFDPFLKQNNPHQTASISEAIAYNLLAPGKRIRPYLITEIASALQLPIADKTLFSIGLTIEQVHCYSLIHDDLPAMDDAKFRRARQCTHLKFNEATAILAGDALLTDAFHALSNLPIKAEIALKLIRYLSLCAGSPSTIEGQVLDLQLDNAPAEILDLSTDAQLAKLYEIQFLKTGCLFAFASISPALLETCSLPVNKPNFDHQKYPFLKAHPLYQSIQDESLDIQMLFAFSFYFGLLYQLSDDLLDVESSFEKTGKDANLDTENNKENFYSLYGKELLMNEICQMKEQAASCLHALNIAKESSLFSMLDYMEHRDR